MEEIEERGLGGEVFLTNTGCFGICEKGPVVVVYPENVWYASVTPDDVTEILDQHIEGGTVVERLACDHRDIMCISEIAVMAGSDAGPCR